MDIPLNQGFLDAFNIVIPENSLINPSKYAAVCAGNGMTSQRVTDCLFKAFGITSATGCCMNGLNFGTGGEDANGNMIKGYGYTETVGQGNCAGIISKDGERYGFHGFSGTRTNMTNTRITDPEVLEQRYPCLLNEYCIRENSGGKGKFNGGNGLIREFKFLSDVHFSLVTQRRVFAPWGIHGGEDGKKGEYYLGRNRGNGVIQWIQLPSLAEISIKSGNIIRLLTPGGGGFGKPWVNQQIQTNIGACQSQRERNSQFQNHLELLVICKKHLILLNSLYIHIYNTSFRYRRAGLSPLTSARNIQTNGLNQFGPLCKTWEIRGDTF